LYETFQKKVGELYEPEKVKNGVFAAMMDVALINDGPVGYDISAFTSPRVVSALHADDVDSVPGTVC
jgi:hypothetical protein